MQLFNINNYKNKKAMMLFVAFILYCIYALIYNATARKEIWGSTSQIVVENEDSPAETAIKLNSFFYSYDRRHTDPYFLVYIDKETKEIRYYWYISAISNSYRSWSSVEYRVEKILTKKTPDIISRSELNISRFSGGSNRTGSTSRRRKIEILRLTLERSEIEELANRPTVVNLFNPDNDIFDEFTIDSKEVMDLLEKVDELVPSK